MAAPNIQTFRDMLQLVTQSDLNNGEVQGAFAGDILQYLDDNELAMTGQELEIGEFDLLLRAFLMGLMAAITSHAVNPTWGEDAETCLAFYTRSLENLRYVFGDKAAGDTVADAFGDEPG